MAGDPKSADGTDHLGRGIANLEQCALYQRTLQLSCRSCPHSFVLDGLAGWWLFHRRGWDDRLPGAMRRFYCSKCWHGRFVKVSVPRYSIGRLQPSPGQPPYPDVRDWKRLVGRYRS